MPTPVAYGYAPGALDRKPTYIVATSSPGPPACGDAESLTAPVE